MKIRHAANLNCRAYKRLKALMESRKTSAVTTETWVGT